MAKKIVMLALGGTIASSAKGDRSAGVAPRLKAEDLVASVPQLAEVDAEIEAVSFLQLPSPELTLRDVLSVAAEVRRRIAAGADGIVITQGTDTLEETAFILDTLLSESVPVVITGAMRNPDLAGPDGPANLLAAVQLAAHAGARDLGVLVVLNDEIHAGWLVKKTHTTSPATFRTPNAGPIGWMSEGEPHLLYRPLRRPHVALPDAPPEKRVFLVKLGLGDDGALIEAALERGCDGLVIEGFGGGHVPARLVDLLADANRRLPIVISNRTGSGAVLRRTYTYPGSEIDLLQRGLIPAGSLDGVKARLYLQLLLMAGTDADGIRKAFDAIDRD